MGLIGSLTNTRYNSKKLQVFKGVALAIILLMSAIIATNVFSTNSKDQYNYMDITNHYSWDFSSGLALSQSISDQQGNLLYFDTSVNKVEAVLGQSTDIQATCDPKCPDDLFGYASTGTPYYAFNTTEISSHWSIPSNGWETRLNRMYTPADFITLYLPALPLSNVSKALTTEISQVTSLHETNSSTYSKTLQNKVSVGDIEIHIFHAYNDGTAIALSLFNQDLFIQVSHFTKYYGDSSTVSLRNSPDQKDQYYIGSLDVFFVSYTQAINELLAYLLGV